MPANDLGHLAPQQVADVAATSCKWASSWPDSRS
jgi:hypothetical protein